MAKYTVIPEEGIDWLSLTEQCVEAVGGNRIRYGSNKNYNSKEWELDGSISAPLYQEVLDWFREKHQIHIKIMRDGGWWIFSAHNMDNEDEDSPEDDHKTTDLGYEDDYIDGLNSAIEKALKLIP